MKSYFQQYDEFATACEKPAGKILEVPPITQIQMNVRLVNEEWREETLPALDKYTANPSLENFADVADGIADTIYVLCELARSLGVPLDAVWNEVHASNMRKVGADGKVGRREDGKILKPEGWKKPDVWTICFDAWKKQQDEASDRPLPI